MAKYQNLSVRVQDLDIPLRIYQEWRSSIRISIGKNHVNLRVPIYNSIGSHSKHVNWCRNWLEKQFQKNPQLKSNFEQKSYADGDRIEVNGRSFEIKLLIQKRATSAARIIDHSVIIKLSENLSKIESKKIISSLLSRVFGRYFLGEFKQRISNLNVKYFNKSIENIRFKNNSSNWGSCSSKRNINLSTRLLFAPKEVQDYVLIHELTHLIEMNHSSAFWGIVKNIVPDYKTHERWLKEHGHLCRF